MAENLEEQPEQIEPSVDAAAEAEPEGVVELQGQRVVPLAALTAERDRVRTKTEEKIRAEYAPIQQKADQADRLAADLAQIQPYIDQLRRHPELMQQQQQAPAAPEVSDEDAEKTARDYELYTPTGLDLARAKRIIAKNRDDVKSAANQAAQEAVRPMQQQSAVAAARQNFIWAASQKGSDGQPLVDAAELAQVWTSFPPEMIADPNVAREVLKSVLGDSVMRGYGRPRATAQEPTFTEAPGGQRQTVYQVSDQERRLAKNVGMTDKQWTDAAKSYKPDSVNILGD